MMRISLKVQVNSPQELSGLAAKHYIQYLLYPVRISHSSGVGGAAR